MAAAPREAGLVPAVAVTGGGEGLGHALAMRFARNGHDVLLVARTPEKLAASANEISRKTGRKIITAAIDLTQPGAGEAIERALEANGFYCDILVNNAGMGAGGPFAGEDATKLQSLAALNIAALTALTRHFLPGMLERKRGGVLNVASLGGFLPGPYQAAYYASKAYVVSLTRALAYETQGSGVRMSVLCPGPIPTRFHQRMGAASANYLKMPGSISAARAARLAYWGYYLRQTVIVPGVLPAIAALGIWIVPHFILTPFVGWLLKKRY